MIRTTLAAVLLAGLTGAASAQSLADAATKPLGELLGDAYAIVATTGNGRPGEVVMTLRREAKHYVCVLSEVRASNYSEAKAKPLANPCIPLN